MWLNRDEPEPRGADGFRPVLELLERSFVPRPERLEAGGRERPAASFLDPAVLAALDRRKHGVALVGDDLWAEIVQLPQRSIVTVVFPPGPPADEIRTLFLELARILEPTYARCHLEKHEQTLYRSHYEQRPRTFYASGLYWLNLFGPDEEARQGGPALADNPHARVERRTEGLLLEIGEGPEQAASPEGEQALLAATAAMPPLPGEERVEPAELVEIGGERGWRDPADRSFWVTKHLDPAARLGDDAIARLGRLRGGGDPPITQVHVLFSSEEAAQRNAEALRDAGVETWFVAPDTGQPAPV
jgi:hypothetical protein